jgi:DNA repair protein RecO (recombination protein O)
MFVHHRTQAIVLKKVDHKENDQLFTLYTKDFGKIDVIGKGIRKISSKLRSSIDVFYLTEIEFVRGRANNKLIGVNLLDEFNKLHKDLAKLSTAYIISDVLDKLLYSKEKDEKLWILILGIFEKLDKESFNSISLKLFYYRFLWRFFVLLGYGPQLYNCVRCGETLKPKKLHFNSRQGGIVCQNCFGLTGGLDSSPEIIKILRVITESDWLKTSKLKLKREYLDDLQRISEDYQDSLAEKRKIE